MSLKNTDLTYGTVAKAFHWIMFLILLGLVFVGFYMHDLPAVTPEQAAYKYGLYDLHKSFGLLIILLVVLRLGWRLINPVPKMPGTMSKIETLSAQAMHILLYVMMFAQPLTGWLRVTYAGLELKFFGVIVPPIVDKDKEISHFFHETHETLALVLIALFVIHVAASLFHHYIRKDDVMRRMLLTSDNDE